MQRDIVGRYIEGPPALNRIEDVGVALRPTEA